MRFVYPARLRRTGPDEVVVSFRDLPECLTSGADEAEALASDKRRRPWGRHRGGDARFHAVYRDMRYRSYGHAGFRKGDRRCPDRVGSIDSPQTWMTSSSCVDLSAFILNCP